MNDISKPYKMTPERVQVIVDALSSGMTQRDASMLAGISEDTFCLWKRTNSEFSEKIAVAVVQYKQNLLKRIEDASKKDWKACAWLLERRYKREFSSSPLYNEEPLSDFPRLDMNIQNIVDRVITQI